MYIITYNKESKNNIIQNMKQYNIIFDHILWLFLVVFSRFYGHKRS